MFLIVSVHAVYSIFWFHGNGNINPILSVFTSNTHYNSFLFFPFQTLGFFAYVIIVLMAFTSHDFWLAALKPWVWKSLHMMVYLAYFLVILHVVLGVLQLENNLFIYSFILFGLVLLSVLHIWAGYLSFITDNTKTEVANGWQYVCTIDEIEENKAKMLIVGNERVAVFKYDNKLSAVHNVCKHQNGPLGEGKIVDGCITCPWHGYQYQPQDGCSPAPFTERVATYNLKLDGQKIYVDPTPLPEGTFVEPITFSETSIPVIDSFYIGWQAKMDKPSIKAMKLFVFPSVIIGLIFLLSFTLTQNKIAVVSYSDNARGFTGTVSNFPFPNLSIVSKDVFGNPSFEVYPLINANKFGADDLIAKWCGKQDKCLATISAYILTRENTRALTLDDGFESFSKDQGSGTPLSPNIELVDKDKIIRGEIIDPKCYLGAMNPGEGKPHRSCAIRCISGGIMPMITYKENGEKKYAVLLGEQGEKINEAVLDYVAEPVSIKGKLYKYGNWSIYYINPKNIIRTSIR
jgi:nitrite reductase/ring-hydroxylating ferredoxin subunit